MSSGQIFVGSKYDISSPSVAIRAVMNEKPYFLRSYSLSSKNDRRVRDTSHSFEKFGLISSLSSDIQFTS